MSDMFFDKKCSIFDTVIINEGGEDYKSYHPIYSDIDCDWYTPKNTYKSNNQAREFENNQLEVVLAGDKTEVQRGNKITLKDSMGNSYGDFVVDDYFIIPDWNGRIDNIVLRVSQR